LNDKRVLLGQLSSVYGVKGWIKVTSHTQPRENIFNYPEWLLKIGDNWQLTKVEQGRPHGKTLVAKLAGCDDRDQAQLLVNTKIAIYRSQLPETNDDEYYWLDLLGMQVITVKGNELGEVAEILETGSNDVLVIKKKISGKTVESLVPWLEGDVIINVDKNERIITVDWQNG
jgi:16S rRNA processing protein RimM